jgi:hypothetical protein
VRVRVILDCEWEDLQHALDMVIDAKPSFDNQPDRPGWGWSLSRIGRPTLFVRRTKRGYSATATAIEQGLHLSTSLDSEGNT